MKRTMPTTITPPPARPRPDTHQPISLDDANAALGFVRTERDRARAALLKYGRHLDGCAYLTGGTCGCGLHEEIARQ